MAPPEIGRSRRGVSLLGLEGSSKTLFSCSDGRDFRNASGGGSGSPLLAGAGVLSVPWSTERGVVDRADVVLGEVETLGTYQVVVSGACCCLVWACCPPPGVPSAVLLTDPSVFVFLMLCASSLWSSFLSCPGFASTDVRWLCLRLGDPVWACSLVVCCEVCSGTPSFFLLCKAC